MNGRSCKDPRRIKREVRRFFKQLYSQKNLPDIKIQNGLVQKLSKIEADSLEILPSPEEIKEAVWSCDPSKAPGPDGFNMNFIRKSWEVIGDEFQHMVIEFFETGQLLRKLNMTWVALIPKFEGAQEIKDFRPISMVGSIYKVISKILVRRLRNVLNGLVGGPNRFHSETTNSRWCIDSMRDNTLA